MTQKPVFGLHTAEFKRWITQKEAGAIKTWFNLDSDEKLTDNTYFYQDGLTRIWLEEVYSKKARYYLHVIVNFARVLRIGNFKAMPFTTVNIKKVFTTINKTLKILPLSNENQKFQEWTPKRIDSTFDIYEEHTALLMWLLNYSLNLSNTRKRCKRINIPGKMQEESVYQSMRFGNASFIYNVYRKMEEIQDKGKSITKEETEEIKYLLRIERQNHEDAIKQLLPNRKAGDLANVKVQDAFLKTMIDEVAIFWGKGDYYSWREIEKAFIPNHEADIRVIVDAMKKITNNSLEKMQDVYTKKVKEIFDRLRISPVGIKKEVVKEYDIDKIEGIYNRIVRQYVRPPDKRKYSNSNFPHQKWDSHIEKSIF